jgi:hypothetical protein
MGRISAIGKALKSTEVQRNEMLSDMMGRAACRYVHVAANRAKAFAKLPLKSAEKVCPLLLILSKSQTFTVRARKRGVLLTSCRAFSQVDSVVYFAEFNQKGEMGEWNDGYVNEQNYRSSNAASFQHSKFPHWLWPFKCSVGLAL